MAGIPNPMLWSGGDPLDELGKIERSVRTRRASNGYLSFTPSVSGNRKTLTIGGFVKRGSLGGSHSFFDSTNPSGTVRAFIRFNGDDKIWLQLDAATASLNSASVYRDLSAWLHWNLRIDTPQAVAANRFVLEIDGAFVTGTFNYPALNADTQFSISGQQENISGAMPYVATEFFDGESAFYYRVDGQSLPASSFGQFHPRTGQWRPKSKAAIRAAVAVGGGARNGWGANGFFLPFDDVTSLTTLGYDRSQSDTDTTGNNWTATNISLTAGATYDSMLDTPTNNFCTWNGVAGSGTLSNGGLDNLASYYQNRPGSLGIRADKFYFEGTLTQSGGNGPAFGLCNENRGMTLDSLGDQNSYGLHFDYSGGTVSKADAGALTAVAGLAPSVAPRVGIAIDATERKAWVRVDGVWLASGNPETGANPFFTGISGTLLMPWSKGGNGSTSWNLNCGQRPFIDSAPTDFKSLCTKNLPIKHPVMKGENAFVARTDAGANIVATLAAAALFSDWIKIYKRREASEGWRWQFSDDTGFALESNNTNAKIAFPALSGTSYVGYALKVSAANGIASGRLTHTNGAASFVTDGLANSRKVVMLRNEAGGNWFFHHPDLTAGKLLYLNLQSAETTDATINTVTASGFTVASALASGTYRWISLAEVDGFLKLWKYIGNASSDGPFHQDGLSPAMTLWRDAATGTNNWHVHDSARDPANQSNLNLIVNESGAESSQHGMDLVSSGVKIRNSSSGSNASGSMHIGLSFAAFPFRYANAR